MELNNHTLVPYAFKHLVQWILPYSLWLIFNIFRTAKVENAVYWPGKFYRPEITVKFYGWYEITRNSTSLHLFTCSLLLSLSQLYLSHITMHVTINQLSLAIIWRKMSSSSGILAIFTLPAWLDNLPHHVKTCILGVLGIHVLVVFAAIFFAIRATRSEGSTGYKPPFSQDFKPKNR